MGLMQFTTGITAFGHAVADGTLATNPTLIDQVVRDLTDEADKLRRQGRGVTRPVAGWFGGSSTGRDLARHSVMAHEAVADEFQKLADALGDYRDAVKAWDTEVGNADDNARLSAEARERAAAEVESQVAQTRQQSTGDQYGDGVYEPPTSPEGTGDGTGSGTTGSRAGADR